MKTYYNNKTYLQISKIVIIAMFCLSFLVSCKNSSNALDELQAPELTPVVSNVAEVKIKSWTPTTTPNVFTSSNTITYAVAIEDGAGAVTYKYLLDSTTILQESSSPFYTLDGSTLSLGGHTLQVTATNSRSSDSKTFNLRRNTPTSIISYSPTEALSLLNCNQDTLTMSAVTFDTDSDSYTYKWLIDGSVVTPSTAYTTISNTTSSAQLAYSPACAVAGMHTFSLEINDGHEITTKTWTLNAVDPSVETITTYNPSSNNITALSTDTSKVFNVSGSGVGALTFIWKLDGVTTQTNIGVTTSTYILNTTTLTNGDHTLSVFLTDGTTSNDPPSPVKRDWLVYKNQKPKILSPSPDSAQLVNLASPLAMSANIQDAGDTFTTIITKGALSCVPSSECGLSSVVLPTTDGTFSTAFLPGTTFLGENNFQLKVTDSYGEYVTYNFTVTANYFSKACNELGPGKICTMVGLPGLGGGINVGTEANKIRITPARMTKDDQGNWFFSDHATNTVWYHNQKSTPVTLWTSTVVAANSLYVVAGTGVAGIGSAGQAAKNVSLNFGTYGGGLAWDSDRKELFIADYSNHRVIRVGQNGVANILCGSGSSDVQGALATTHRCDNVVDLRIDSTNRRLYASSYARHVIKYFDISDAISNNWQGYILAGVAASAGNTDGSINISSFPGTTTAGAARLNGPWGMYLDNTDKILYFTDYLSCRVRALGLPGSTSQAIGAATITATNLSTLAGSTCASAPINTDTLFSSNIANRPYDIAVEKSGANVRGIYVADFGGHRINFMNTSGGNVTIGNQVIANNRISNIFGTGGSTASNPPSGKNFAIVTPVGLYLDGSTLYVGARGNSAINSLNISVTNGTPNTNFGGTPRASYSGNSAMDSKLVTFNNPMTLHYRSSSNQLFVSDSGNAMIRAINLTTGRVEDYIGTGTVSDESLVNTPSTSTRMRAPRGMASYGNFFLYADGANNNNFIRAYNTLPTDQVLFNTMINANRTNSVAGYFNTNGTFDGTSARETTDALAMLGNPYGLGVDVDNNLMYLTSYSSHCVFRVTSSGFIKPVIGTCGTQAGSISLGESYPTANSLYLRNPAELIMDPLYPNSFFFVDWSNDPNAHVKYVNLSGGDVNFFGNAQTIGNQTIGTVLAQTGSPGYIRALAAFDTWICYTSGTISSNQGKNIVVCKNRTDGSTKTFGTLGDGGIQASNEQEGFLADGTNPAITFAAPAGLTFDANGNLYISEQGANVIRMIKRWW